MLLCTWMSDAHHFLEMSRICMSSDIILTLLASLGSPKVHILTNTCGFYTYKGPLI